MVFGWLCGGHAGLRPRLEHQEHDFDKSNFCFKNLPNMADLPNHRCRRQPALEPACRRTRPPCVAPMPRPRPAALGEPTTPPGSVLHDPHAAPRPNQTRTRSPLLACRSTPGNPSLQRLLLTHTIVGPPLLPQKRPLFRLSSILLWHCQIEPSLQAC